MSAPLSRPERLFGDHIPGTDVIKSDDDICGQTFIASGSLIGENVIELGAGPLNLATSDRLPAIESPCHEVPVRESCCCRLKSAQSLIGSMHLASEAW